MHKRSRSHGSQQSTGQQKQRSNPGQFWRPGEYGGGMQGERGEGGGRTGRWSETSDSGWGPGYSRQTNPQFGPERGYPEQQRYGEQRRWNPEFENEQYGQGRGGRWEQERYGGSTEGYGYSGGEYDQEYGSQRAYSQTTRERTGEDYDWQEPDNPADSRYNSVRQLEHSGQEGRARNTMNSPQRSFNQQSTMGRFAGRGPQGYKRSDERILEDINEYLTQDSRIDASQISVECKNGEVVLKGTVSDRNFKRMAEEIAESRSGVKDVQNQIRIKREEESESDQRRDRNEESRRQGNRQSAA